MISDRRFGKGKPARRFKKKSNLNDLGQAERRSKKVKPKQPGKREGPFEKSNLCCLTRLRLLG